MGQPTRQRLCSASELPLFRGGRLFADVVEGVDVILFRIDANTLVAYNAACPHVGAQLRPENEIGGVLTCSLHQWRFNVADGTCETVPRCPLTALPIEVVGPDVYITLG